jgi:hypothetical protein
MDFSYYDDMDLYDLYKELAELHAAIENEHRWSKGAHSVEDLNMHAQNIADLRTRMNYVTDLIEEREMA